jgi:hypothetical protein
VCDQAGRVTKRTQDVKMFSAGQGSLLPFGIQEKRFDQHKIRPEATLLRAEVSISEASRAPLRLAARKIDSRLDHRLWK